MATDVRPSGVPGLVIVGTAAHGYSLHWQGPERLVTVWQTYAGQYADRGTVPLNHFPRVRDAKAAADRLRDVLPWSDPAMQQRMPRYPSPEWDEMRTLLIEGLAGRTVEEMEREYRERREQRRQHYGGRGFLKG